MRCLIAIVALLAVAASSRGGCGKDPWAPCAGKACGAACTACDPADRDCLETAVVKACDAVGTCRPAGDVTCAAPGGCEGEACGTACTIEPPCRLASPPCMMPSIAGFCDGAGTCSAAAPPCPAPPPDPCAGKACGAPCDACPPGFACAAIACMTSCDAAGRCSCGTPTCR